MNVPFGGRRGSNVFARVRGQAVPTWASEFATSWAQFFLKWIVGHPAVTAVTPATSRPTNMADNIGGGVGPTEDDEEALDWAAMEFGTD